MNWHFYSAAVSDARARWLWVCEDPAHRVVRNSRSTFDSYAACLSDALEHGYRSAIPDDLELHA